MSTEIELKLELSPKSAKKLAAHPLLAAITPQKLRLLNTYYDTPKLELHARRIAMRFRQKGWQWLLTVKSAEPASGGLAMRSEWETAATPGTFAFGHVDNPELRSFLEQSSELLTPVFTTDFKRQIWHVPFGESMIELAIDRGGIESQGRNLPICEVELELLSGRVDDIFGLTRRLQEDIDLVPAIASKAERGYNLFADAPERPFRAKAAILNSAQTPVEAFRSIALGCLEHFQRNEKGLLNGSDTEFVHQARVALRRLRSAIKLFAPVLPAEFVTAYGQTWQTLASAWARHATGMSSSAKPCRQSRLPSPTTRTCVVCATKGGGAPRAPARPSPACSPSANTRACWSSSPPPFTPSTISCRFPCRISPRAASRPTPNAPASWPGPMPR